MQVGHGVSCFMLRQMEYDADRYECQVAGSVAFRETMLRLVELNVATSAAYAALRDSWRAQRLPDSLPQFIVGTSTDMAQEVREETGRRVAESKTGLFDTHPCDTDRIRAAEALDAPGVFRSTDAATALFRDFASLSRQVTRLSYEKDQALPIQDCEPGGHRDVPPRDERPARHSGPVRALLRRGEHAIPSDLDRPGGAAAAVGSRRGPRRAPIGPRADEGGREPGEVRPETAEADRRAPVQRRERPRAADGGLRDRAGSVRLEGRHTRSGERGDRDPGRREAAERGSPGRVQRPSRGPPAGGAATAEQPFPGAAHRGRAGPPGGGGPARPGAGSAGAGPPSAASPRREALPVADAPREPRPPGRPGQGGRRHR